MQSHDVRAQFQYVSPRKPQAPQKAGARDYRTATLAVGVTVSGRPTPGTDSTWYDTLAGKLLYWGFLLATLLGVWLSATGVKMEVPAAVYLFGFLGATVYVFTSFADRFDKAGRYRLIRSCVIIFSTGAISLVSRAETHNTRFHSGKKARTTV